MNSAQVPVKKGKWDYSDVPCFKGMSAAEVRKIMKGFTERKLEGETIFKKNGGYTPGFA